MKRFEYARMEPIMQVLLPLTRAFRFRDGVQLITIVERVIELINDKEKSVLVSWSNPLMVLVLTIDVLFRLQS